MSEDREPSIGEGEAVAGWEPDNPNDLPAEEIERIRKEAARERHRNRPDPREQGSEYHRERRQMERMFEAMVL